MKSENNEQARIRAYLLGRMAEADLSDLEETLLVDAAFYEELSIVEDELIDEYLRGELTSSDRESFESHFMSTRERSEKLRFGRALKKRVGEFAAGLQPEDSVVEGPSELAARVAEPPPKKRAAFLFLPFQNPIASYALTAAILLVVAGISWVVWKNWSPTTPGKVLAIELTPSLMTRDTGDADIKKFAIAPDIETVRLQLDLPSNEYSAYEALIKDANSRAVATNQNLKPQSPNGRPTLFIDVPPSSLPPGDYRIKLSGVAADGGLASVATYFFRILQ